MRASKPRAEGDMSALPRPSLSNERSVFRRPPVWLPALVVAAVYGLWTAVFLMSGHDARDLIRIEARVLERSHRSTSLRLDPQYHYEPPGRGYDGMYYYFIAVDPVNARYYLDSPPYRYTRIVYPLLARIVARGQASAIPYAMVFINVVAMSMCSLLLAICLRRRKLSPWWALVFGLYAGLFLAVTRDLTEPLAYAFVLVGIVLIESGAWRFVLAAGLAFGLASLTRETLAVFPIVYACVLPFGHRTTGTAKHRHLRASLLSAAFLAIGLGPLLAYKFFLAAWMPGAPDASTVLGPDHVPFHGITMYFPWDSSRVLEILCVVVPAVVCGVMAVRALRIGWRVPELWALLVNVVVFVVFLNSASFFNYTASGRIAAGVVLCSLLCIPSADASGARRRAWLWISVPLWLILTPVLYLVYLTPGGLY